MSVTEIFMSATAVIWIIFDIYIIKREGKSASISAHVIRWVNANRVKFLLIFSFGVVCGHLFWNMNTFDIYKECKRPEVVK